MSRCGCAYTAIPCVLHSWRNTSASLIRNALLSALRMFFRLIESIALKPLKHVRKISPASRNVLIPFSIKS